MSAIRLAGLIIGSISLVLIVVSLAIPYWIFMVDKEVQVTGSGMTLSITANIGFWDYCIGMDLTGYSQSKCGKFYESGRNDMTDASVAMLLLGMLFMVASVIACGTSMLCMKESKLFPIVGGVCAVVSGTCMLIGVVLYGYAYWRKIIIDGDTLIVHHTYGPCFYMAIVATFIALVSGGLQIASRGVSDVNVKPWESKS